MKIRTDFITNSSSYSTTEIIIDNPVLLKILQKYKNIGLFGDKDPIIGIGVYESQDWQFNPGDYQGHTKTPAFFYDENQNDEGNYALFLVDSFCPKSLDEVLEDIIFIMDSADEYLDGQILEKLKEELDQRKDEVNQAFNGVYWRSTGSWTDGSCFRKFEFDPVNGSSYVYKDEDRPPTTEIAIDNPILLEILQKYKEMGLFGDKYPIIGIGDFDSTDLNWGEYKGPKLSGVPAFYYFEQEGVLYDESLGFAKFSPKKLVDVVEQLILIMENGAEYLDEQFLALLIDEISRRKDEINQAFSRVYWSYWNGREGEEFEFDPIIGESYEKRDDEYP